MLSVILFRSPTEQGLRFSIASQSPRHWLQAPTKSASAAVWLWSFVLPYSLSQISQLPVGSHEAPVFPALLATRYLFRRKPEFHQFASSKYSRKNSPNVNAPAPTAEHRATSSLYLNVLRGTSLHIYIHHMFTISWQVVHQKDWTCQKLPSDI